MSDIPTLYIVPTPIGNLADITQRALDILRSVDLVAAEDTRHTGILLSHYQILGADLRPARSQRAAESRCADRPDQRGQECCAGLRCRHPAHQRPGYHLVTRCREAGVKVVPLPGPCAAITALSAAGLPTDRFAFEGFLPAKSKGRDDRLQAVIEDTRSLVFYESPRRVQDTVEAIARILGERQVVVCRELTKTFESIHGLPASEMLTWLGEDDNRCRGEIVLVVAGAAKDEEELPAEAIRTLGLLVTELPLKKRLP